MRTGRGRALITERDPTAGQAALAQLGTMCQEQALATYAGKRIQDYTTGGINPIREPRWQKVLNANDLGTLKPCLRAGPGRASCQRRLSSASWLPQRSSQGEPPSRSPRRTARSLHPITAATQPSAAGSGPVKSPTDMLKRRYPRDHSAGLSRGSIVAIMGSNAPRSAGVHRHGGHEECAYARTPGQAGAPAVS